MVHKLKIHPQYFNDVALGLKKVEIRLNDRNYQENDRLILQEFNPETNKCTGETLVRVVKFIVKDCPGLMPNYVALQIEKPL